jgi:hypothetical protein
VGEAAGAGARNYERAGARNYERAHARAHLAARERRLDRREEGLDRAAPHVVRRHVDAERAQERGERGGATAPVGGDADQAGDAEPALDELDDDAAAGRRVGGEPHRAGGRAARGQLREGGVHRVCEEGAAAAVGARRRRRRGVRLDRGGHQGAPGVCERVRRGRERPAARRRARRRGGRACAAARRRRRGGLAPRADCADLRSE